MLSNSSLSFITNNVKGIQPSKKRLKLMQYFKDKIGSTGVLFLQETHSNSKVEQNWKEDFYIMGKDFIKTLGIMFSMAVLPQSIFY